MNKETKTVLEKACKQFDRVAKKRNYNIEETRLYAHNVEFDMWCIAFDFTGWEQNEMRCLRALETILKRLGYKNYQLVFRVDCDVLTPANYHSVCRTIVVGGPLNA